ncbi:hypothetical protein JB92DRAFT_2933340 [Gautieria morchelliformis]|nr:hypothetical protein JB92DRAFT_2933340 [Gautieria morchelliformis]
MPGLSSNASLSVYSGCFALLPLATYLLGDRVQDFPGQLGCWRPVATGDHRTTLAIVYSTRTAKWTGHFQHVSGCHGGPERRSWHMI